MVLRKICNFAKIAPFQLNIFNVVKRLFYVILYFWIVHTIKYKHLERCYFQFWHNMGRNLPNFQKLEIFKNV